MRFLSGEGPGSEPGREIHLSISTMAVKAKVRLQIGQGAIDGAVSITGGLGASVIPFKTFAAEITNLGPSGGWRLSDCQDGSSSREREWSEPVPSVLHLPFLAEGFARSELEALDFLFADSKSDKPARFERQNGGVLLQLGAKRFPIIVGMRQGQIVRVSAHAPIVGSIELKA